MSFEIDGLDDLQKRLEEMQDAAREIDGENEIPLVELFPPSFMQKYTDFQDIEEFFDQSPWNVESQDDLEAIPQQEFDSYVSDTTQFDSGEEMQGKAVEEWAAKELGF